VLTGSLGRGAGDRWSDIDLDAVLADGVLADEVASAWEALAYQEWEVAHHYSTTFDATLVRGFLLRSALLLDMAFTPVAEFAVWAPVRVVFDRTGRTTSVAASWSPWSPTPDPAGEAGFAAHDVLHACVAANRGRLWQSLYFLQRIRSRTLALASERHGWDAEDLTRADDMPADELESLKNTLISSLERDTLLAAIDLATRAFLTELRRHDAALSDRLSEPLLNLTGAARGGGTAEESCPRN
jgi:hypothetical protein